jgi:capsular polysaccharide transport system permease protein
MVNSPVRLARPQASPGEGLESELHDTRVVPSRAREVNTRAGVFIAGMFDGLPRQAIGLAGTGTRRIKTIAFLLIVLLPTFLSAIYFYAIAANQYVTEFRLGVRAADAQRNDATSIFQGTPSASYIGLESNVVVQYIQSREIVDALQKTINLRQIFSTDRADFWSRLNPAASIEELVEYWKKHVDPYFDMTTGTISVRVRAFTPDAAELIGKEIIVHSEQLVNDLSQRARSDFVKQSQDEVARAEERLRKARLGLLAYQNQERTLDPKKEADASLSLIGKLREELARSRTEAATARAYINENSPSLRATETRIRAIEQQLKNAEAQRTSGTNTSGDSLSETISEFNKLDMERQFAERYYSSVMESLEKAQSNAARQMTYLSTFVHPGLPERSDYPRRTEAVLLTLLASIGLWIFLTLMAGSIIEHT